MKMFVLLASLVAVSAANAAEYLIYQASAVEDIHGPSAYLAVNRSKTEAFVNFTTTTLDPYDHRRQVNQTRRVKVEGLEVRDGNTIQLTKEGALVDCATVVTRGSSIFRRHKITETGCSIEIRTVKKVHHVFLVTK